MHARRKSFDSLPALKERLMATKSRGDPPAILMRLLSLWVRYVRPYVRIAFGVDKRSAALFRLALAITVLGDVVDRAHDLSAHYTDAGVVPRRLVLEKFSDPMWFSLHMLSGGWWAQALLFSLHLLAALVMLVGWHSRKATFVVWLMTISLQVRNILVLHSGDVLLRCSLFWALFLPLGDVFSLDAAFARPKSKPPSSSSSSPLLENLSSIFTSPSGTSALQEFELDRKEANDRTFYPLRGPPPSSSDRYAFINVGSVAVLMQVALMYFTSVYHKTGDEWLVTGTATYFALQLDYFRMPLGTFMLNTLHPHLLPYFTFAVYYWEWMGSALMVFPFKTGPVRCFAVVGYMFMHLGFGLSMRLATFSWAAESALTVLLPSWFWDDFLFVYVFPKTPERTRFELFYGERSLFGFHERFAKVAGAFFLFPEAEVKPLHQLRVDPPSTSFSSSSGEDEEAGRHDYEASPRLLKSSTNHHRVRSFADLADASLVAVDHNGQVWQGFRAVVSLCRASPVLWPLGWALGRFFVDTPVLAGPFLGLGFVLNVAVEALLHFVLGRRLAKLRRRARKQDNAEKEEIRGERPVRWYKRKRFAIRYLFTLKNLNLLVKTLVGLWLVYFVFGWNMNNIGASRWAPSHDIRWVAKLLHIDQAWNMFSPHPPQASWYYVIQGTLLNEDTVEMHKNRRFFEWTGAPLDWSPPDSVPDTVGNHRWFKFYEQVNAHAQHAAIRLHWGRYICREWNKRHVQEEKVYEFRIWYMSRRVELDGSHTDLPKQQLWHHVCYDSKPDVKKKKREGEEKNDERRTKQEAEEEQSTSATLPPA